MYFVIAVVLVLLAILIHEYAHAYEMNKYGVKIESAGLGIPIWRCYFQFRHPRWFYGVPFKVSPLLLAAYVNPGYRGFRKIEKLPYKYQADIYGAGIWTNLLFGLVLCGYTRASKSLLAFTVYVGIVMLVYFSKKILCRYIFVPAGFALLGWLCYMLFTHPLMRRVGGSITLGKEIYQDSTNFHQAIILAGLISISLAIINLLPMVPMDGG